MKAINENTAVTLGMVVVIVTVTIWIANIQAKGDGNSIAIERLDQSDKKNVQDISSMSGDIKVIRSILENMNRESSK